MMLDKEAVRVLMLEVSNLAILLLETLLMIHKANPTLWDELSYWNEWQVASGALDRVPDGRLLTLEHMRENLLQLLKQHHGLTEVHLVEDEVETLSAILRGEHVVTAEHRGAFSHIFSCSTCRRLVVQKKDNSTTD